MTDDEYLKKILEEQTLGEDSDELKALRQHRDDVEALLVEKFDSSSPTIRYGGSKAKGTMIKESYDLDVICYFENDDTSAGESLKDIYRNVKAALTPKYSVEEKPSALRLKGCDANRPDFHIDVVPGRFTDDKKEDVYLYRSSGDKERLKTNLQKHIDHVKDGGVQDAIRLMKLWRLRNGLSVRNFILELLTVKLLDGKSKKALTDQLEHVWTELRDNVDAISVEDPANPSGNDLSELFSDSVKDELKTVAEDTLSDIEVNGWQLIFGSVEKAKKADKREALRQAPVIITSAPKPWSPNE